MLNGMKAPVFLINGFLESGKTTFIREALERDPKLMFQKVMLICCEEGEEEYEPLSFVQHYFVENKEDFTSELLSKLEKKYAPTYIIIEYNGVWGMDTFYNVKLPDSWIMMSQFTVIDAETFESYFSNMKSLFADMLRSSDRVYMNRCTREDNFKFFKDSIKSCSPAAEILYLNDEEGPLDITLEEDLPYDLNSDLISLNDDTYITWYIDMMDNVGRYVGKNVEYVAIAGKPDYFRDGYFLAGNMVMTCCEDDMEFFGFVCKYDNAEQIKTGAKIKVRGEIHYEYAQEYEKEGPVIYVTKTTSMQGAKKKKKKR